MYVIVAGGGALGRQVTQSLVGQHHDVVLIDIDAQVCDSIYADLGAVTILGSATDLHTLEDAGGRKADAVIAVLHADADNIACALMAHTLGVQKVISRLRDESYEDAYRAAGVTHPVRATHLLRNQIIAHLQYPTVREIVSLEEGMADIFAVDIPAGARCVGMSVRELAAVDDFPSQCLLVGIAREGTAEMMIPRGDTRIRGADAVYVIARRTVIERMLEILTRI